jgi:hypothetical protein
VNAIDRDKLIELLSSELCDSYDCTRVWCAWGVGTMDQDDFVPVEHRVEEIADAIIALTARAEPQDCPRAPVPFRYCPDCNGSFPCQMPGRAA